MEEDPAPGAVDAFEEEACGLPEHDFGPGGETGNGHSDSTLAK